MDSFTFFTFFFFFLFLLRVVGEEGLGSEE
jgi:hypothetical protein